MATVLGFSYRGVRALLAAALLVIVQLAPVPCEAAAPKLFLANLNAAQETPATGTGALGNAFLTFDSSTRMLCYDIAHSGLSSAEILAHIHGPALPDVAGAIQFALPIGTSKNGCVGPLSSTQKSELYKNLWYINIHSSGFPGGEIRGQILRIK
jgi:hypothetical protein